ncbi:MAG: hypothetical protein Q7J80_15860 [Anaerolineales bacterium]|nr:hypothetical protein [Anaerolineales bacterium]
MPKEGLPPLIMTIGHSTHTLDEFIRLLQAHGVTCVVDVRTVPWRCHRSLIADALLVRGIRTEDIMNLTHRQAHTLTPFAKVRGAAITYPTEASESVKKRSMDGDVARSRFGAGGQLAG